MSKRIKEVTAENLSSAVEYAYALNKQMHSNVLALKIVLPLGSILFALHSLLLFLGVIGVVVYDKPERLIAFNALPFITKYWNGVWGMFSSITEILYVKIILMVVFLFLVPFAICSIATLIIFCLTKAEKRVIGGNTAQRAKQLYAYLDKSPRTYFEAFDGEPVLWRRICGIVSGLCIIVFMIYFHGSIINQSNDFLTSFSVLFQSDKYAEDILISIFFGVLFYAPYAILHYIFTLLIQPYCDCYNKWKKLIDKVEFFWVSIDAEERKRREEEASRKPYDGWKYRNLEKSLYYKEKFNEYYAQYTGQPYETDDDRAKRLVREVEEDMSGGGWGDY